MNIHEHQAKQILKKYGAIVPEGIFSFSVEELLQQARSLNTKKFVLKAQIHAGGRGKAGGIKILNTIDELNSAAKEMLGKKMITNQTGPDGREVKRLYVETSSEIEKEFYLSCLVDRTSSKIAFISTRLASTSINILYIDLTRLIACFFGSTLKLNISTIFSQSLSNILSSKLTFVVIIFFGLFFATSSISIPPWSLEINAILELVLSTKQER